MRKLFSFFIVVLISSYSFGQILDPVDWVFESKHVSENTFKLVFKAKIDKTWHLYSQHLDGDGPVPTSFTFDETTNIEIKGDVKEIGTLEKEFDPNFEMILAWYSNQVSFEQLVELTGTEGIVKGYLTYMTCDDSRCLPPEDVDFSFTIIPKTVGAEPKATESASEIKPKAIEPVVSAQSVDPKIVDEIPNQEELKDVTVEIEEDVALDTNESIGDAFGGIDAAILNDLNDIGLNDGILEPVKWESSIQSVSETEAEFSLKATIDDGWHIYGMDIEDGGPIATRIEFDQLEQLIDPLRINGELIEGFDDVFEMNVSKYKKQVEFIQKVKLNLDGEITGFLEFMACESGRCLPPEEVAFKIVRQGNDWKAFSGSQVNDMAITAVGGGNWPEFGEPISDCIEAIDTSSIFWTFIKGLSFGILALLTPCVFPMIPLTVSFFTKSSGKDEKKNSGIMRAAFYGLSILAIYLLVSVPFWIANIPTDSLSVISTSVVLNLIFFAIFLFFAFSFFGYYELTLPSKWANKTDKLSGLGGYLGIFFMALTLVIVSFSCTGPLLGVVLAQTISGGNAALTAALAGFGIALGLPFALFAMFPKWLEKLPKSGGWLNTVKVCLGFIELALALKFLSNADLVSQWGFLKREVFLGLWILIFVLMGIYLLGKIKFSHDSPIKKLSTTRIVLALLCFLFAGYMVPGLMGKNLPLLSGFPPPSHYSIFHNEDDKLAGLTTFQDYEEGMAYARENNMPVMLDFTGWACVNCRKMEENVWVEPAIFDKLKNDYVIISLYVDERTQLPEDEKYISRVSNKNIKTIGNLWSDFQIASFVNNSQPWYALVTPDEKLLANPVGYTPNVEDYADFLDCGLRTFQTIN